MVMVFFSYPNNVSVTFLLACPKPILYTKDSEYLRRCHDGKVIKRCVTLQIRQCTYGWVFPTMHCTKETEELLKAAKKEINCDWGRDGSRKNKGYVRSMCFKDTELFPGCFCSVLFRMLFLMPFAPILTVAEVQTILPTQVPCAYLTL